MGKEDKIGTEAFRWARAKVFNCNKTSVGRAIAFGCATRCHLLFYPISGIRSCNLTNPSAHALVRGSPYIFSILVKSTKFSQTSY